MAPLYRHLVDVELERPVLVVAMDGWIDAGFGAAAAAASLLGGLRSEVIGEFDADELIDFRARRPMLRLVDGVNTGLTWPSLNLRAARDGAGNDLLLLFGPEPDARWHAFADTVADLAGRLGVRLMVGLGAFPAPVPHTRPVRLASTASTAELAAEVGYVEGAIEVPAGASAALERALAEADIPTVGLWARVPHYVAAMPFPAASAALVDGLASVAGLTLDSSELKAAAEVSRSRIDTLIAQNSEHTTLVAQLEEQADSEQLDSPITAAEIPSGDELAAELERFLREQGTDG